MPWYKGRLLFATAFVALLFAGCGEDLDADNQAEENQQNSSTNHEQNQDEEQNQNQSNGSNFAQNENQSNEQNQGENQNQEPDGPWAELPEQPWDAADNGPFEVAYRYESFDYTPLSETEQRPIDLSIWYPTFEDDGFRARYIDMISRPGVWSEAEPALREPAPVMLFSHGNGGISAQSYFWTEYLASHGWIVISPDHTGNTFIDMEGSINLESAVYRPQDLSASLDYVLELPNDDPLSGWLSDDIAVSGHSFGGYTTLAISGAEFDVDELITACDGGEISDDMCSIFTEEHYDLFRDGFRDPRIEVAIPHTPGGAEVFADGLDGIEIPVFLWTAAQDATLPNHEEGDPIWEGLNGPNDVRIDALETGHFTFSNMCDFAAAVPEIANDGCGEDFMDADLIHGLINQYSLQYLRLHLFGDKDYESWFEPAHDPLHDNLIFSYK